MGASAIGAGISAGGSILGGITGGKGAAKAARIQAQAEQAALNQQQAQFNVTQQNIAPDIAAGQTGLSSLLTLLGIGSGGTAGQQSAIDALKASPAFTSQYDSGLNAINQSAAATGDLRGGNNALAESDFGSQLLAQLMNSQEGQYSNLASLGANAATGLGNLSQSNSNAQSGIIAQQGNANATAAASPYLALQNILKGLGTSSSSLFGSNANPYGNIDVAGNVAGADSAIASAIAANPISF